MHALSIDMFCMLHATLTDVECGLIQGIICGEAVCNLQAEKSSKEDTAQVLQAGHPCQSWELSSVMETCHKLG